MIFHILNGDALKDKFPSEIEGGIIVLREAFIEGPTSLKNIFPIRAQYFKETYQISDEEFIAKSIEELTKISHIPSNSKVYLWFEDDLFCQTNLWYAMWSLEQNIKSYELFLVRPNTKSWLGFGPMNQSDLLDLWQDKLYLPKEAIVNFSKLWTYYVAHNLEEMIRTSDLLKQYIPRLSAVIEAHINRQAPYNYVQNKLKEIILSTNDSSFGNVFKVFSESDGIYGYGDLQLKRIYEAVMQDL